MAEDKKDEKEHGHDTVVVFINGEKKTIDAGSYVVAKLKEVLGVPADKELAIKDKEIVPLKDDETITVHNGEKFVSHARHGSSS
jgi:uncharacterized protein YlzI (FlbEa/FlbD family)